MTDFSIPVSPTAIFLSHGGGPLPVLGDERHAEMVDQLSRISAAIRKPSAIVVVSAHWEEEEVTITSASKPPLIYDYYGFPPASYELQYPAAGVPELAARINEAMQSRGIPSRLDPERGFDHGMFVPLMLMYPDADIPCVQVSLLRNLDPEAHIRVGQALSGLADDNVLVIGSGFSFHNLRELMRRSDTGHDARNEAFESWLLKTCHSSELGNNERAQRLVQWSSAPEARYSHPREEHLLPLHVCFGVTGKVATWYDQVTIMGKRSSTFFW